MVATALSTVAIILTVYIALLNSRNTEIDYQLYNSTALKGYEVTKAPQTPTLTVDRVLVHELYQLIPYGAVRAVWYPKSFKGMTEVHIKPDECSYKGKDWKHAVNHINVRSSLSSNPKLPPIESEIDVEFYHIRSDDMRTAVLVVNSVDANTIRHLLEFGLPSALNRARTTRLRNESEE